MSPLSREEKRLDALQRLQILDTAPESDFNDLVSLASDLCGAPISLLTLVDRNRQWFKAAKGLVVKETERSVAFCAKAILQDDIFVVPDAQADPRFADNPLVTGDPNIRFYAGALVHSPEGYKLGTLCIIDTKPRELSWREANILGKLARQATQLIELRSRRMEEEILRAEMGGLRQRLEESNDHYQRLAQLSQLQNESVAAFFDNGLDSLHSGRFTKKDLAAIREKAGEHRAQIASFTELLTQLARYRQPADADATHEKDVNMLELVQEIVGPLQPIVKAAGNKVQPFIPSELRLRQDRAIVHSILQTLLTSVLQAVGNAEVMLQARRRDEGLEFTIALPEHNLMEAFGRFMTDAPTLGSEQLLGRPFHVELALLHDLITEMGGQQRLHAYGNRGTAIELYLPDRA